MPRKRPKLFFIRNTDDEQESHLDKIGNHLYIVLLHVASLFSLLLFVALVCVFIIADTYAIVAFGLLVLVTSPVTIYILKQFRELGLKKFFSSLLFLGKDRIIQNIFLFVMNVVLFFRIGLQTMIPLFGLLALYLVFSLFFIVFPAKINLKKKATMAIFLGPFIVNFMLGLNYLISFNAVTETYVFSFNYETVGAYRNKTSTSQRSTLIRLKNDQYSAYPGIRLFWDYHKVYTASKITYTFKTGILGIRVMTDYYLV